MLVLSFKTIFNILRHVILVYAFPYLTLRNAIANPTHPALWKTHIINDPFILVHT